MRRRSIVRAFGAALLSMAVAGCSFFPSDYYGTRAVEYNREAEDATLAAMLLNIVRASQRRPMQFTSLQSVTGTASASGSISGGETNAHSTPLYNLPTAATSIVQRVVTGTGSGTASISGGPNFTVPVLDTQEFYQGILTPVPLSVIDFYLQEGFPPELLADLFILSIEVTRIDERGNCERFVFRNDVSDDLQFGQFQAMVDYLMVSGFIAERINKTTAYGPAIPPPRAADSARAVDAFAHAAQAGLDVKKDRTGKVTLEKKSSELRTCFLYKGGDYPAWLAARDKTIFCGHFSPAARAGEEKPAGLACRPRAKIASHATAPKPGGTAKPTEAAKPESGAAEPTASANPLTSDRQGVSSEGQSEFRGIAMAQPVLDRIKAVQIQAIEKNGADNIESGALFPVQAFEGAHISMKFQTRSTEGILYYLGEIVRRRNSPEYGGQPRTIQTKSGLHYGAYPMEDCNGDGEVRAIRPLSNKQPYIHDSQIAISCDNIFVINEGPGLGDSVVSVLYNGVVYSIPHSREVGGRSSQVTELVKQILNLNTSAKQLPQTTVISVVGGQ
ncbi:MAG TPA: hypothetical protein VMI47_10865 [Pseudolabrys sp.]|nr:hypothetical protein [Pseudolabrys sp.]